MTTAALALHLDAITAKYRAMKDWRAAQDRRLDTAAHTLGDWSVTRLESGDLYLSARILGPDPAGALLDFEKRQSTTVASFGDMQGGDRMPSLDCTVSGRTACVWRLDGVWVEVWHPDTPTPRPAPPVGVSRPVPKPGPPAATSPSGRLPRRLTTTRRTLTKEN
ncbi:hypothetical protein AB0G98_21520 [Streptomyces sp. NPDC020196]|uniref:hypothetical protein n=1 Tax=Streptomyces sp. NPDC020196 TaxID=3156656 RepID=UPI0033F8EB6D